MKAIHTLGHSTRPVEELVALLAERSIELLVDVRRFPGSRRHPQFAREALAATLAAAGIDYLHAPGLGGRRPARPDSPNTAWRVEGFRGYADHMASGEFRAGLDDLVRRGAERPSAILCAEAVPWRCHRRLIADALVARGVPVRHILGPGRDDPHELHPDARLLPDGGLVYPAGGQAGLFDGEGSFSTTGWRGKCFGLRVKGVGSWTPGTAPHASRCSWSSPERDAGTGRRRRAERGPAPARPGLPPAPAGAPGARSRPR